jgi:hypothetical protein
VGSTFVSASSNVRRAVSGSPCTRSDTKEERIEKREGHGDDAKAERNGRHDRRCDERSPSQHAEGEGDVAHDCLQKEDSSIAGGLSWHSVDVLHPQGSVY